MQNSEPLGPNLRTHGTDTGDGAARSIQAGDEAKLDRIAARAEDDRNCGAAGFGGERGWSSTGSDDDGSAATDQIGRQFRQPLGFIVRPSVFDLYVAALGEADLAQAFAECREHRCAGLGRTRIEISDHRRWRLLRPRRQRPSSRRAAEQRDELAPSHSITSSASASSDGGTVRPSAFAVARLITNWNLEGCSTGRSAGFVPLRIRST